MDAVKALASLLSDNNSRENLAPHLRLLHDRNREVVKVRGAECEDEGLLQGR